MSFFKDFKDDLFQAVNDILPPEEEGKGTEAGGQELHPEMVVNTLEQEVDVQSELKKLEGLFEKVGEPSGMMEEPARDAQAAGMDDGAQEIGVEIVAEEQESENALGADMTANTEMVDTLTNGSRFSEAPSKEMTIVTEGSSLKGDL